MLPKLVACGMLLLAAACVTPGQEIRPGADGRPEQARARLEQSLSEVNLTFFDSETLAAYSASGPYRFLGETAHGVEFEGYDALNAQPARITLFEDDRSSLWARMRVADREFLTRLR